MTLRKMRVYDHLMGLPLIWLHKKFSCPQNEKQREAKWNCVWLGIFIACIKNRRVHAKLIVALGLATSTKEKSFKRRFFKFISPGELIETCNVDEVLITIAVRDAK